MSDVELPQPGPKSEMVVIAAIFERPDDSREVAKIAQIIQWAFKDREHVQIIAAKDAAADEFVAILRGNSTPDNPDNEES